MSTGDPPADAPPGDGPYRELRAFDLQDERLFFGRSRERRMVAANFLGSRLTLLYGPSGVGKTSLLRAGVAAELATRWRRRGARRQPIVVVYPLRHHSWADPPLAGLMAAIDEQLGEEAGEPVRPWDGSRPAIDTLREWTGDGRRILLVLDQFEEYLRYHPTDDGEGNLAAELPRIVADPDLPVNVLIAIREDALARLDRFKATMPGLFDHYLRVDHLDEAAAREAIVKPLAAWGRMGGAGPTGIEDEEALVRAVLDDDELRARAPRDRLGPAGSSSGAVRRIETPYLQLVMSRLWEAERDLGSRVLRVDTLTQRLGGPAKIVNEHLAAAMRRLEREQGREATRLAGAAFGNLVTESGSKFALTAGELANAIREPEAEGAIAAALDVLCRPENRILRKVESAVGPEGARYELSHDVLGRAVQGWAAEEERRRLARARARARRRAMVFAGLAAFMAALLVVSLIAYAQLRDEKAATRSRQLASEAEATVDRDPVGSLTGALEALDHPTPEAERALRLVEPEQRLRRQATLPKGVNDVSSDERANLLLTAGASGLTLFERRSPRDPRPLTPAVTYSASVSADGRLGVSGGVGGAKLWDLAACRASAAGCRSSARLFLPPGAGPDRVALAQGGVGGAAPGTRYAAVTSTSYPPAAYPSLSRVSVFDLRAPGCGAPSATRRRCRPVWVSQDLADVQGSIAFSSDGSMLAAGDGVGLVRLWRRTGPTWRGAARAGLVVTHESHSVGSLAFSPDGELGVATWKSAAIFDVARCRPRRGSCPAAARYPHPTWVQAIAFGAGGTRVATGDDDGVVRVWDRAGRGAPLVLHGNQGAVFGLRFGPGGALFSVSNDGAVRQWDVRRGEILTGSQRVLKGVAYAPAGGPGGPELAATVSEDRTVRLYDLGRCTGTPEDGRCLPVAERTLAETPMSVAFDAAGDRLVVGDSGGRARVLAVRRAARVGLWPDEVVPHADHFYPPSTRPVVSVAFNPAGDSIATVGSDYLVRVRHAETSVQLTLPGTQQPFAVGFTPAGELAVAGAGGVFLWRVGGCPSDGTCDPTISLPTPGVVNQSIAVSGDGRIAAGGSDGIIRVWDRVPPARPSSPPDRALAGHTGAVSGLGFSPDGELLASAGVDGTTRVWEAATGEVRGVLHEHGDSVNSVMFTKDGRILSGSDDRTARIYGCVSCGDLESAIELGRALMPKPFGQ
jgi:WD40 repeat protein